MAYRRRQGMSRSSTFKEEIHHPPETNDNKHSLTSSHSFSPSSSSSSSPPSQSLAAQAIRASAAHRQSSLSPAYSAADSQQRSRAFSPYEDGSLKNESKGFWGVLARKAKAILDDEHEHEHDHDHASQQQQFEQSPKSRWQMTDTSPAAVQSQQQQPHHTYESFRNVENQPSFRRGLDKITYSLNQIGDTFEKAFEEGKTMVENKTADIIQETRKLQIRRKGGGLEDQPMMQTTLAQNQTHHETQLKASRDVAMATAAKAKLLLRELKSVKADLAFAKQRCAQLEEENKLLRESREKGQNPADDDLIRLQLETLLAEKARLAHDNSVFARENRFLREIVEYHQLTMQDVVYLDEGTEEVTEVYPISFPSVSQMLCVSSPPLSPISTTEILPPPVVTTKEMLSVETVQVPPPSEEKDDDDDDDDDDVSESNVPQSSSSSTEVLAQGNDAKRPSVSSSSSA
ncbi:hypothetical protein Ddye_009980 [Dipteronia dyeriana]|uniref:Uncharacterized protein n=1 Tax=Dipteronia dyeriana TaxID=168575 RepID=A0AAD9XCP6_9ROSI|nr:hypothetical protein Ddye_009980 [Dipteronia dyeriana]